MRLVRRIRDWQKPACHFDGNAGMDIALPL